MDDEESTETEVTDELFVQGLEGRYMSASEIERAIRIRWQWVHAYNQLLRQPRVEVLSNLPVLETCESVIAIIDDALAIQPTIH